MSRRLQAMGWDLHLVPADYQQLEGMGDPSPSITPAGALTWSVISPTYRVGSSFGGASWSLAWAPGLLLTGRVALVADADGTYTTDTVWDVAQNDERTARTPVIAVDGLRGWLGIEVYESSPDATATVRYRLWDGAAALWWDATANTGAGGWVAASTVDHWNTAAELTANFAQLSAGVREVGITAWLRTSDARYTPAFYGARLLGEVAQISSMDDALIRSVLSSLRSEVTATGVSKGTAPSGGLATVDLAQPVGGDWSYDVIEVEAVLNLTADPEELVELAGTWDAGAHTWTPATAIPAGDVYRVEFEYRPDLVVRRNHEITPIARRPSVIVTPGAPQRAGGPAQGSIRVRDRFADPPTFMELASPELYTLELAIEITAGLGADVQRLAMELRGWLGAGGYRRLVSPETARMITVREIAPITETVDQLARGLATARGSWLLSFHQDTARSAVSSTSLRSGGLNTTLTEN